jgi:hypothetical protein
MLIAAARGDRHFMKEPWLGCEHLLALPQGAGLVLRRLTFHVPMPPSQEAATRMSQTMAQWEVAFEQESALERRRREQLRQRAVTRSRARRIQRGEQRGKVAFGVLFIALAVTVVTVVVVMFEALAWLMAP